MVSWVGLARIVRDARATDRIFAAALDDGLGAGWGNTLNPDLVRPPHRFEWRRVMLPFAPKRAASSGCAASSTWTATVSSGTGSTCTATPTRGPGAPVLLQIHGGGWVIGNKDQQGLPLMYHLATRGWVCVAINYRLSPKATWPDHLVDCKRALAWIRAHIAEYGGDPDYVVVTGGSAGGHLTALMGLTRERPAVPARLRGRSTRTCARWCRSTASTTGRIASVSAGSTTDCGGCSSATS